MSADLLARCGQTLLGSDAVLGPASDGGWWLLGVRTAALADCLRDVPMSRSDTGELTRRALQDRGIDVVMVDELADVDTADDVERVRRSCPPGSRFAFATAAAGL